MKNQFLLPILTLTCFTIRYEKGVWWKKGWSCLQNNSSRRSKPIPESQN